MSKTVTIVMYHYVRDLKRTRFPSIKARTIDEFRSQINYLKKIGNFISTGELIDSVVNGTELPENSLMVSFDDGYIDHFTNVLPILHDNMIEGMFFPPVKPIVDSVVLDVNKIHFILASEPNINRLIDYISSWISNNKEFYSLTSFEHLWGQYSKATRYDSAEIVFVKLTLQRGLPKLARNALVSELFRKYVTTDESAFSAELYMTEDQIKMLHQCGQSIGSHGYTHEWFDVLGLDGQETEISESVKFLSSIGMPSSNWIMCYPYGCHPFDAVNQHLRSILLKYGCACALTDHGGITKVDTDDRFFLSRIDTNEIPIS